MNSEINQLVVMRDSESLYELMTEDEEWLNQLEAAEGLVKLGDRRGYEFLMTAMQSDDEEILEVAREILASPEVARMRAEIESEQRRKQGDRIQAARRRLQSGGKVFRYKMVYVSASDLIAEDAIEEGYEIGALEEHGFDGWEIVHMLPNQRSAPAGNVNEPFSGAYFLLKKEVLPGEANELDS